MQKVNIWSILRPMIVLLLICALMAGVLAVVNALTADRIAENTRLKMEEAMRTLFPEAESFSPLTGWEDKTITSAYRVENGEKSLGLCIFVAPQGFQAPIEMAVAVSPDASCAGVRVISWAETKAEPNSPLFLDRFLGKQAPLEAGIDIEVISGATVSSRAMTIGVNAALCYADTVLTEEGGTNYVD